MHMCICVAYCLVDLSSDNDCVNQQCRSRTRDDHQDKWRLKTQPIVQKYSKEGFLEAPWCLIKRFFHFIALPFWRSYPRSLISLPNTRHILYLKLPRELIFQNISSFTGNILVCVCVFPLQALVWNWGLFIWTIWLFRLGSLLPPLNLHPSYPSDIHKYNSYRVELCSCIDVNVEYRDWC